MVLSLENSPGDGGWWQVSHFYLVHFYNALKSEPNRGIFFSLPDQKANSMRTVWGEPEFICLVYTRVNMSVYTCQQKQTVRTNESCKFKMGQKAAITPALSWPKVVKSRRSKNIKRSWITIKHSRLRGLAAVVSWVDVHRCNRAPLPFCVPSEMNHRLLWSMRICTWKSESPEASVLLGNR